MTVFSVFWQNLSKIQKIGLIFVVQVIFIITIVCVLNLALQDRQHIEMSDDTTQTADIPDEVKKSYEKALWKIISQSTNNDKSVIEDVVVREDSLIKDVDEENKTVNVRFLVDIDSIQQTYVIYSGWTEDLSVITEAIVDCPSLGESKYPNSICHGTYNDTYSLSLYLPYTIYAPQSNGVWDVIIDGSEVDHEVDVMIQNCNTDELKKQAQDYLNSIPTDLSDYRIEYHIENLDASYYSDLTETEIRNAEARCSQ